MNRTEALRNAGAFTVPAALVIGGSMLTLSLTSAGNYRTEAAPPRPAPTVTTTAPGSATESPRQATPRQTNPPAAVIAVHQPGSSSGTSGGMSSQAHPSGVAPSGPSPRPPAAQQPAPQCNVALTAAALNACIKLGGSR